MGDGLKENGPKRFCMQYKSQFTDLHQSTAAQASRCVEPSQPQRHKRGRSHAEGTNTVLLVVAIDTFFWKVPVGVGGCLSDGTKQAHEGG